MRIYVVYAVGTCVYYVIVVVDDVSYVILDDVYDIIVSYVSVSLLYMVYNGCCGRWYCMLC